MNTIEINKEMQDIDCFKGTFAKNKLPIKKYKKFPIAFIINTDTSDKPGKHWVALFINKNKAEYFDSFGVKPICCEIKKLLNFNKINKLTYNKNRLQSNYSSVCGAFCILFIKMRCNSFTFKNFIVLFSKKYKINDLISTKILTKTNKRKLFLSFN